MQCNFHENCITVDVNKALSYDLNDQTVVQPQFSIPMGVNIIDCINHVIAVKMLCKCKTAKIRAMLRINS